MKRQPLGGVGRVERQVRAAGLEHRQQRRPPAPGERSRQSADPHLRAAPPARAGGGPAGWPARPARRRSARRRRRPRPRRPGCARPARSNSSCDAPAARRTPAGACGSTAVQRPGRRSAVGEQRQVAQRRVGRRPRPRRAASQVARPAARWSPRRTGGAVLEPAAQPAVRAPRRSSGEVELGAMPRRRVTRSRRRAPASAGVARPACSAGRTSPGTAGCGPGPARGCSSSTSRSKGDVLVVRRRRSGAVAHPAEQVAEARVARQVGAQHQGVDEEADQALGLRRGRGRRPGCRRRRRPARCTGRAGPGTPASSVMNSVAPLPLASARQRRATPRRQRRRRRAAGRVAHAPGGAGRWAAPAPGRPASCSRQ